MISTKNWERKQKTLQKKEWDAQLFANYVKENVKNKKIIKMKDIHV